MTDKPTPESVREAMTVNFPQFSRPADNRERRCRQADAALRALWEFWSTNEGPDAENFRRAVVHHPVLYRILMCANVLYKEASDE